MTWIDKPSYTISSQASNSTFVFVCLENLAQLPAYKGTPSQSSTYHDTIWTADKAVDGHLEVGRDESTCSFTQNMVSQEAWWKLPLNIYSNVAYLEIQFRRGSKYSHTISVWNLYFMWWSFQLQIKYVMAICWQLFNAALQTPTAFHCYF